jgi:hypothetical protein
VPSRSAAAATSSLPMPCRPPARVDRCPSRRPGVHLLALFAAALIGLPAFSAAQSPAASDTPAPTCGEAVARAVGRSAAHGRLPPLVSAGAAGTAAQTAAAGDRALPQEGTR